MAIGVDIEDIHRFTGKSQMFLDKIFTQNEQKYCKSFKEPQSHFAVRFCAKEAVIKALTGLKITGIYLNQIEIFHDENKCPQIRILKQLNRNIIFNLSLSHDSSKAIAFVTAEEK